MKKISLVFSAIVAISITISGCLKDTDFNNNKYGIKDPASSPDGVGFTLGNTSVQTRGLDVSASQQTISDLLIINLFAEKVASSDITMTVLTDTTIVNNYNVTNGTSIVKLPINTYNSAAFTTIIKAGQRLDSIPFVVSSTAALDPNRTYGVGFRITTVSNGYTIANNYSTIFLSLNIKNKYDGKYSLKGAFLRTDIAAYTGPFTTNVQLQTTGPNSVGMYWPNAAGYAQPWSNAGSLTYFSNVAPNIFFNLTTNKVTSLTNLTGTPPMSPFPGYDSRYDPATKTIYLKYYYNTDPSNRVFTDTLIYTGPR